MANNVHIDSHDLQNVISIDDLTIYLTEIIVNIRKNSKSTKDFKTQIEKLREYEKLTSKDNIETLFNAYKQIQKTSISLRKLLNKFTAVEVYDNINYAFYYNNKRYYAEELKLSWLTKSTKTGELRLRLNTATQEIQTDVTDIYREKVNEIFNNHYKVYLAAIEGTYKGVIGRGGALNKGHIAEAYESHMREHHPSEYKVIRNLKKSNRRMTIIDEKMISYENEVAATKYWNEHEGLAAAWMHIKDALGIQRGTVAGDVVSTQVKQSKTNASRVRLARFNTLLEGIQSYTDILNENLKPEDVALKIAKYISEPVRKVSATIIDGIADKRIRELLEEFNNNIAISGNIKL